MVKRNKTRKIKKNNSNPPFLKKILNSVVFLYIIFILSGIKLFSLFMERDNESLFLYIIIGVIIYVNNKNMIFVLGIPLVIVILLRCLKSGFNMKSGFVDRNTFDYDEFKKWISSNIVDNEDLNLFAELEELPNGPGNGNTYTLIHAIADTDDPDDLIEYTEYLLSYIDYLKSISASEAQSYSDEHNYEIAFVVEEIVNPWSIYENNRPVKADEE